MIECASIVYHINEFNVIVSQASLIEIDFENKVRALILLLSLPDSWNTTITAISNSSRSISLTFDGVQDLILSEGIRRRESSEHLFVVLVSENRERTGTHISSSSMNLNR